MAFPLLPLLLLFGGGAAVASLVAAKNARGEDVMVGRRSMQVAPLDQEPGVSSSTNLLVSPDGRWEVRDIYPEGEGEYAAGSAANRKAGFNAGFVALMATPTYVHGFDPQTAGLRIDFVDKFASYGEVLGEGLIFRVSIIPTTAGWLTQITDPSATVKMLKTYSSRAKAIHEAYAFVEKAGY